MKRSLLILAASAAFSLQLSAKGGVEGDSIKPTFRAPAKNNWFVGAGVGASVFMGDNDFQTPGGILKNTTPLLHVQIGKWLTPSIGVRWQMGGATYKGWDPASVNPLIPAPVVQKMTYLDGHIDVLWSVLGDQTLRKWNYTILAGVGGNYNLGKPEVSSPLIMRHMYMVYKVGAIVSYNINDGLSAFAEAQGSMLPDQYDGYFQSGKYFYDGATSLSVGLNYKFSGTYRGFKTGLSNDQISEQNNRINELYAAQKELEKAKANLEKDNVALKQSLVAAQNKPAERVEVPIWIEGSKVILEGVVKFATNKSKFLPGEEAKIAEAAAELKKQKDLVIEIGGYANGSYGTKSYNMSLSNRRAKYVAAQLSEKYNVPAEQIQIVPYGINKNPMTWDGKNKVVVFYLKKK